MSSLPTELQLDLLAEFQVIAGGLGKARLGKIRQPSSATGRGSSATGRRTTASISRSAPRASPSTASCTRTRSATSSSARSCRWPRTINSEKRRGSGSSSTKARRRGRNEAMIAKRGDAEAHTHLASLQCVPSLAASLRPIFGKVTFVDERLAKSFPRDHRQHASTPIVPCYRNEARDATGKHSSR